ncbi:MAG TPA: tRNA uridine-5-carboxymethylaminomethyl(34) synthesis GTPase MnmE [Gemmatimonadaceae bacterium]|nr:tRNA uridine-5-carboxymethylaminomethyl(34) synthesis GTPase MnmE [Gemmatimonadaceae bacterium]
MSGIAAGVPPGQLEDTIVALATPAGRGATALIRLSGCGALVIAAAHVKPWSAEPRKARLCTVYDGGHALDQALVTIFPGPDSFTGDDVVEISTHGGVLVPASIIAALISSGARQALPGEFTRRAVMNGKMDLIQAEAIGDLIEARSYAMHRTALDQLEGGLSRRLLSLREELIGLEALIAYDIDFPEEDDGPIPRDRIDRAIQSLKRALDKLLATSTAGELVREGALVVIAGAPNVGKSSLFNALLGKSRAIVTEIPGTTRDAIEAVVDTGSWPLRLVDTAGLRATDDRVERLGIEVSERYLSAADVILACADSDAGVEKTAAVVAAGSTSPVVKIRTKSDLVSNGTKINVPAGTVVLSAETADGLQELITAIDNILEHRVGEIEFDSPMLTRARHRSAVEHARSELAQFERAWREEKLPATVASVHLRTAVGALEELVGTVDVEDVFDRVFNSFCVGK